MDKRTVSAAKYSAVSLALGASMTQIIIFFFPHVNPISEAIMAILTFFINVGLAKSKLLSDE